MSLNSLGQGQMDIAQLAGKYIGRGPVDLFWNKGIYQQAIPIDKDQRIFCLHEQGIPERPEPVSGDLPHHGISFFYKNRSFYFYFRRSMCGDAGRTFYLGCPLIAAAVRKK